MSGSTRATRQRSKPIIVDLRRTGIGYEILDDRTMSSSSMPKPTISRPERQLNHSKSMAMKNFNDKDAPSPTSSATKEGLNRSKTMKPVINNNKISFQNGAPLMERNPLARSGGETIKRELFPFSNLSMPSSIKMGHPIENSKT